MVAPGVDTGQAVNVAVTGPPDHVLHGACECQGMLASAAADFQDVAMASLQKFQKPRGDDAVVAVKRRGIEALVFGGGPAALTNFHPLFRHRLCLSHGGACQAASWTKRGGVGTVF
jgi:hypothetical protein